MPQNQQLNSRTLEKDTWYQLSKLFKSRLPWIPSSFWVKIASHKVGVSSYRRSGTWRRQCHSFWISLVSFSSCLTVNILRFGQVLYLDNALAELCREQVGTVGLVDWNFWPYRNGEFPRNGGTSSYVLWIEYVYHICIHCILIYTHTCRYFRAGNPYITEPQSFHFKIRNIPHN